MKRLATTLMFAIALIFSTATFAEESEHEAQRAGEVHEHGSEADEPVISNWFDWNRRTPPPFGFALINFGIFLAIMYKLAAKPLKDFVSNRHLSIRKDLDEASRLHAEAQAKLTQYSARISGIDAEIDALLAQIKQEAEAEKASLIASAEAQAKRLKEDATRQVDAEIDAARRELRRVVVEAATKAAAAMLTGKLTADDQKRIADSYIAELEKTKRPTA